jgi:hypothetical protein
MTDATDTQEGSAALKALGGVLAEAGAASLNSGQQERLAESLLRASLAQWENPQVRPRLLKDLIAALTSDAGADKMRVFLSVQSSELFSQFGKALGSSKTMYLSQAAEVLHVPPLNINAAQAQVWGMVILRYVLEIEPIASAPVDELLELLAPTIQRYLTQTRAG